MGTEHGRDQNSCVHRLSSSGHKAECKARRHLRIVPACGKISDRNESRISVSCHKASHRKRT
jgi:hypothetical protein